jgi:hypothetical protein
LLSSRTAPDASQLIAFGYVQDLRINYNPFRRGERGLYPVRL